MACTWIQHNLSLADRLLVDAFQRGLWRAAIRGDAQLDPKPRGSVPRRCGWARTPHGFAHGHNRSNGNARLLEHSGARPNSFRPDAISSSRLVRNLYRP